MSGRRRMFVLGHDRHRRHRLGARLADGEVCMTLPMFEEAVALSTWERQAGAGGWR